MRKILTFVAALFVGATLFVAPATTTPALASSTMTQNMQAQVPATVAAQTVKPTVESVQAQIPWDCTRYTRGTTICASKGNGKTYALKNGKVVGWIVNYNIHSRFGGFIDGKDHTTPNGTFPIYYFVEKAKSNKYFVKMPFYIKFRDDGTGIHYSEDFDKYGRTISHGCVGLKSEAYAKRLFYWAQRQKPLPRIVVTAN